MTSSETTVTLRPYEQDDVFRSRHVVDGRLSPDGSFAVYQLSEMVPGATRDEDRQLSSLWQVDLAGGEPKRLTPKGKDATSPQLTPDGRSVLFLSKRDATGQVAQVYRLSLEGGEAEEVTSLEQGVVSFALSPDGEWIAFSAQKKPRAPQGSDEHVRIQQFAYRFDIVRGYIQDIAHAIYLVPSTGGEPKALTAHDGIIVGAMAWSPDSREIAAYVTGRAAQKTGTLWGELFVVDRDGHRKKIVEGAVRGLFWGPDGSHIGYIANPDGNLSRQQQLFVVSRDGGAPVDRTAHLDLSMAAISGHNPAALALNRPQLTPEGMGVIAPVSKGGETGLYKIALSGPESYEPILSGQRTCKIFDRVGPALLFSFEDCITPSELWTADLTTGRERALTGTNANWHPQIAWPDVEHVIVTSAPGVEIEGWILKPPHCKPPFKTALWIHGGPHSAYGNSFNEDFQELVGAGYAVAFCNPRGSTGYGDAFAGAIIGCWGYPETEDFNAFLDELVKRGIADPDKFVVLGLSGGGHLTSWLIGHTDRFKAAVPEQGVYNMFSMYGTSDIGVDLIAMEMGGPPHELVERYWDLSPIAHAHKCKTPTLLIQGENDLRCPMEQGEQLYTVLKHNGCEVELLRLKDCNHALEIYGPPPLRRFRMDAIKDWFNRHP